MSSDTSSTSSVQQLKVATVNVNGVRAAFRKGMGQWVLDNPVDILALQEVRASTEDLEQLFSQLPGDWFISHDACTIKGRAGVAIASRFEPVRVSAEFGDQDFNSSGRWLEADFQVNGQDLTVVSCYVHSGEVDTPKQVEKYRFLDTMTSYLPKLASSHKQTVIAGDLNVGHRELDIKNWRGNVKRSGFLPQERSYFDRFFGQAATEITGVDGSVGIGQGWVDIGRRFAGEVEGPYTWWSWRGQAFDNDTGWRIDYQMATSELAAKVTDYKVWRAPSYAERWTDHSPVVVSYQL